MAATTAADRSTTERPPQPRQHPDNALNGYDPRSSSTLWTDSACPADGRVTAARQAVPRPRNSAPWHGWPAALRAWSAVPGYAGRRGRMRRVLAVLCGVTLLARPAARRRAACEVAGRASQVSPPPSDAAAAQRHPGLRRRGRGVACGPAGQPQDQGRLVPCEDGYYPVDDRYVDLTGDGKAELVVTLYRCDPGSPRRGVGGPPPRTASGSPATCTTWPPTRRRGCLASQDAAR